MAKELPYFKFEPNAWETGNIQMCSRDSKGLFIDVCSLYWSRLGELPYALALQKLCGGNNTALQELVDHEIIGIVEGQIVIQFLDEQLSEFNHTSEKRRYAANKRWKDASALQVQSKSNAIREEERRGEKRILDPPIENSDWEIWGNQIVNDEDHQWHAIRGRRVGRAEMDVFLSVAVRCGWKMRTQSDFRISLKGFKAKDHEKQVIEPVYKKSPAFGEGQ